VRVLAFRRTLASLVAWTVGAGVAVGVGMLALSLIDSGLASGAGQPLPDALAQPRMAATTSGSPLAEPVETGPAGTPSSRAAPAPSATAGPPRQLLSSGGTVLASCTSTAAYLLSWSPAQGYQVDQVHRGPARTAYVAFRAGTQRVILAVRCVSGIPEPVPGYHEDDGSGGD
jgi:hypothetical protein